MASSAEVPHISREGARLRQNSGRRGLSWIAHRFSAVRFAHLTPAGLPPGIPGKGVAIDGAMQQAAHPGRHNVTASASAPTSRMFSF